MSDPGDRRTYGGRYEVIGKLGAGGMAEVFRARDELLGREVAVKVLSERFARDRSFVERFRREAQAAAGLNHPNIVSLYDYGSDVDTYFIVMEYIDGKPLSEVIHSEGPLMPERAAEIASEVAKALSKAHTTGIVHRDVKPGNIMLTSTGQIKVTDFGIARALTGPGEQTMTQTGVVIGTAAYLSPEQAQGNPVDARSDVYSLGVVLYEMLTGKPPFTGDTPLAIAYKHVREDPVPPSRVNADVPPALDAIVMKALAKNPDNRYLSAGEMQADLERFLAGQKVHATPLLPDATTLAPAVGGRTEIIREDYDDELPPSRAGWWALSALAILIIFGVIAFFLWDNLLGGSAKQVEVPRLIGMDLNDARDALDDAGLDADAEGKPSTKPINEVFKQDPEPGATVDEGDTVTITYSTGARQVEVPGIIDLTLEEAEEVLRDAKLRLGDIEEVENDEVEPGIVLDQSPDEGETVDQNSRVDVEVSAGPGLVTVPNVEGFTQEDAEATIIDAGLVPEVDTAPDDTVEEGRVISQDPDAGADVEQGDTVRILVSEGPAAQEMPDVTGEDGDDAEAFLEDQYGLSVTQVDETEPCAQPPGRVCSQDPDPGTPVESGDAATLYVQPGGEALGPGGLSLALLLLPLGLIVRTARRRVRGLTRSSEGALVRLR